MFEKMAAAAREEGNTFFKAKETDKAIEAYTKAIEVDPTSDNAALCYSNRSACYQMKKDWVKMASDATSCIKLKPTFAKGYTRLALALHKQRKFMESVKALKEALAVPGNEGNEELKKALEESKAKFEKYVREQSENSGSSDANKGEIINSILTQEYQKIAEKYTKTRRSLGETEMQLQQSSTEKKQAELTLRECKTLDPNSNVYRSVGKVYIRSSVKKELENLEKESQKADERMEGLLKKKEEFTRQMKATESELQEITKSIRSGR